MQANSIFSPKAVEAPLVDAPIESAWIAEGTPTARHCVLSEGHTFKTTIWDCTAGSFFWYYKTDETVHILEGECIITDMTGATRTLRPGDAALFAAGDWLHWQVPNYVRKFAVWGLPVPQVARHVLGRMGAKATGIVGRKRAGANLQPPPVPLNITSRAA